MSACWTCETCGQIWCGIDFCIYCDQKVAQILPSQREQVAEILYKEGVVSGVDTSGFKAGDDLFVGSGGGFVKITEYADHKIMTGEIGRVEGFTKPKGGNK